MLKNYSKIEKNDFGTKRYLNNKGELHRLDGPAVEYLDGGKEWSINGIDHRNIDPADEWSDREKQWWFKGKQHRIGGSYYSHDELWRINDEEYTKEDYFNKVWNI